MEIIIGIIILVALVLITGIYFRKKIYKEVDRLEAWKIDVMNRPVTDEISKVKELNMTGQTEELFERWRRQWDEIVTLSLPNIEEYLFDAEELADKYRFSKSNAVLRKIENTLQETEDTIAQILEELKDLIGSEEKNRVEIGELKSTYRNVKKSLLAHHLSFGKAEVALEKKLELVNEKFTTFEEATIQGNYLEAREIVLFIKDSLTVMQEYISEIPQLLTEYQSYIPSQLDEMLDGYKEMQANGFMLDHLQVDNEVEHLQNKVSENLNRIENLEIKEATNSIIEIKDAIEGLYELLEKEVAANHFIQQEVSKIEQVLHSLHEESKSSEEETEFVQQSYRLTDEEIQTHKAIVKQIKHLLKQFVAIQTKLSEDHIAYSLIKEELEDVHAQIELVKEQHIKYCESLQTLRKDELYAREQLSEMRKALIESKRILAKSNVPGLPQGYKELLVDAKESLEAVILKLEEKPLNMKAVNQELKEAQDIVANATTSTEDLIEQVYLVEQVIQYGNRYRSSYRSISNALLEAEKSFRNYEYESALEQAASAIEEIEPGALKRIQAIIDERERKQHM
jgi:septation ring formation regulator